MLSRVGLVSLATNSSAMSLSTRRFALLNPGNNRPLPQMLWDVIERSG